MLFPIYPFSYYITLVYYFDFPIGSDRKASVYSVGDLGSIPGEGNGNPLQCSCLENPKVGGPWWAAVYGVAQSLTRLKQLSSSSSRGTYNIIELKHLDKTHTFY